MASKKNQISERKKNQIDICLTKDVNYKKTNGFDRYEFEHCASTEVEFNKINLSTLFFDYEINYPFLISCMKIGIIKFKYICHSVACQ